MALGEGDASLDEVFESLDQLIAVTPHEVASAKELVESARRRAFGDDTPDHTGSDRRSARKPLKTKRRLWERSYSSDSTCSENSASRPGSSSAGLAGETTVVSTSGEEKTVMAGAQDDITVAANRRRTQVAGSQEDVTTVSEGNEDPTEISGSHDDATVAMNDDSTQIARKKMSPSQEDVTMPRSVAGSQEMHSVTRTRPTEISGSHDGATVAMNDDSTQIAGSQEDVTGQRGQRGPD